MKLVLALWDADQASLLDASLRTTLATAGAARLQVNLDDAEIPDSVLRLQEFDRPLTSVLTVWTDGPAADVLAALAAYHPRGWEVEERLPLVPPVVPDGQRADALAQVAFLRRPDELPYADWQGHWQGPHTQVAMRTQATSGYVQNRVLAALTDETPHMDAVVEELFPTAAMHDIHAFYGSDGDEAELERRMTELMHSVTAMGADRHIDVVPTSRYVFDLAPLTSAD